MTYSSINHSTTRLRKDFHIAAAPNKTAPQIANNIPLSTGTQGGGQQGGLSGGGGGGWAWPVTTNKISSKAIIEDVFQNFDINFS